MNEQKKSVTTFHSKKIIESITFKNRVFCVLKVSGATDDLDIFGRNWKSSTGCINK